MDNDVPLTLWDPDVGSATALASATPCKVMAKVLQLNVMMLENVSPFHTPF